MAGSLLHPLHPLHQCLKSLCGQVSLVFLSGTTGDWASLKYSHSHGWTVTKLGLESNLNPKYPLPASSRVKRVGSPRLASTGREENLSPSRKKRLHLVNSPGEPCNVLGRFAAGQPAAGWPQMPHLNMLNCFSSCLSQPGTSSAAEWSGQRPRDG
jgi:hypothetical protein